jgi:hypothetical protein
MALMLSIMAGMLHDMLYSFGRHARCGARIYLLYQPNTRRRPAWQSPSTQGLELTMFSKLKVAWARMTGGRAAGEPDEPNTPAIDYRGYRIWPTPYRTEGQYQTAGIIEKSFPDGPKQHRFVRADTHQNRDDAVAFAILKAKQIIDLQGDRTFT